jgi:hypothetical protein
MRLLLANTTLSNGHHFAQTKIFRIGKIKINNLISYERNLIYKKSHHFLYTKLFRIADFRVTTLVLAMACSEHTYQNGNHGKLQNRCISSQKRHFKRNFLHKLLLPKPIISYVRVIKVIILPILNRYYSYLSVCVRSQPNMKNPTRNTPKYPGYTSDNASRYSPSQVRNQSGNAYPR